MNAVCRSGVARSVHCPLHTSEQDQDNSTGTGNGRELRQEHQPEGPGRDAVSSAGSGHMVVKHTIISVILRDESEETSLTGRWQDVKSKSKMEE
jgi:hypothetical protein